MINVKQIFPKIRVFGPRAAHVNIEPAVVVDVHQRNARFPAAVLDTRRFSCVLKSYFLRRCRTVLWGYFCGIEVQFIGYHIAREIQINAAIVVKIARCYAATVVKIPVF